eukprot:TRINITY_DN10870_c0_g1_i2.p1 TRINITY_DN10870_c0_g1~~TRINITY_DN10870_c0_g1_i2.p1  ORF type:complete len:112 (+),score=4.20 TRINITY_DN10870_c0_g1_i2:36-371(+)
MCVCVASVSSCQTDYTRVEFSSVRLYRCSKPRLQAFYWNMEVKVSAASDPVAARLAAWRTGGRAIIIDLGRCGQGLVRCFMLVVLLEGQQAETLKLANYSVTGVLTAMPVL